MYSEFLQYEVDGIWILNFYFLWNELDGKQINNSHPSFIFFNLFGGRGVGNHGSFESISIKQIQRVTTRLSNLVSQFIN